jgi:hypothetical protein
MAEVARDDGAAHLTRLLALPLVLAALWIASGCSSSAESSEGGKPTTSAPGVSHDRSTDTTTPPAPSAPADGSTLHGVRYCEILAVTGSGGSETAEVWNTMGLNDCPQTAWDAIDLDAVQGQLGADQVATNGPRYWVLDRIVPGQMTGSLEVRDLDGVEMRSIARVDLTGADADSPAYVELSVERETVFTFLAGREVYELASPDGSTYIMQSYSQQIDPDQTVDDLASLGDRLDLPDGWTFTSRVLTEDLEVEDQDGIATVVTDDLQNTYQLAARD